MSADVTKRFNKLTRATIIAVYILILVGGVVRSTGSGMGCPDWPRCFGQWSPPTSVNDLPPDYKDRYAAIREKKNVKFARYLDLLGFDETAEKIRSGSRQTALSGQTTPVEGDFDPLKSWIEYGNRLVGVVIGFFIIAVAWRSIKLRKEFPWVFRIAVGTLVAVLIQGWFGSIVVSTNLTTWTVTVHMFLALVIVLMLIFLFDRTSDRVPVVADKGLVILTIAAMVVLLVQVFFGTDVRAAIDRVAATLPRQEWLDSAGMDFIRHRSFSWTVLVIYLLLFVKLRKTGGLNSLSRWLLVLTLCTFLTGVGMAYMAVPAYLQPVHLLLATLTFGAAALVLCRFLPVQKAALSKHHE